MTIITHPWIRTSFSLLLLAGAGIILGNSLGLAGLEHALAQALNLPFETVLWLTGLVAGSFLSLCLLEVVNAKTSGIHLPIIQIFKSAFVANALAHCLGASLLGAGTVRLQFYKSCHASRRQKLSALSQLVWKNAHSFVMGAVGILLLVHHSAGFGGISGKIMIYAAPLGWVGMALYLILPLAPVRFVMFRMIRVALSMVNIACVGGILWMLAGGLNLAPFLGGYVLATLGASLTAIPAGIGVFEALILWLMPLKPASLLAALLIFRLVYNAIPFALAALWLGSDFYRDKDRGRENQNK